MGSDSRLDVALVERGLARSRTRAHGLIAAGDVLVNTTSLGMEPDVDATPVPREALGAYELVFDAVYNPLPNLAPMPVHHLVQKVCEARADARPGGRVGDEACCKCQRL